MAILLPNTATELASVASITCPACKGRGARTVNGQQDPITGVWDYDEAECDPCMGAGTIPHPSHYETSTLPLRDGTVRTQWRCLWCLCHVNPLIHLPGSEDCDMGALERTRSQADREDPWS